MAGLSSAQSILGPPPPDIPAWKVDPQTFLDEHVGADVRITSGYRSPEHNAEVGGVPDSAHTKGDAYDFVPEGMTMAQGAEALRESLDAQGIPYDLIYNEGDHVHVSFDPRARRMVMGAFVAPPKPKAESLLGPRPKPSASSVLGPKPGETAPAPPSVAGKPDLNPFTYTAHNFLQDYRETVEENKAAVAADWRALQHPGNGIMDVNLGFGTLRQAKTALDLTQYVFSPVQSAARTIAGRPVAVASGGRITKENAGDWISMLAPLGEGVRAAKVAEREAKALGVSVETYTKMLRDRARLTLATKGLRLTADEHPSAAEPKGEAGALPTAEAVLGPRPGESAAAECPRAVAAVEKSDDPEIFAPEHSGDAPAVGSPAHAGPVVGSETDPTERVDNALYRLGGHSTADKLEAQEFLKSVPPELSDPKVQNELADEIERQIVDPNHQIPDHLKAAYAVFEPWRAELIDIANRLRESKDPDVTPFLPETGHTPRRVAGYTPIFDSINDPDPDVKDPILGKRSLSTNASSLHARTAGFVATDEQGHSVFMREAPKPEDTSPDGLPFTHVRQATMAEVEANTEIRYHKNPLVNTVDEVLRLRRVERNIQVLEEIKQNLKGQGLAHQDEWHFKNEDGQWVRMRSMDHIPQLKMRSMDHIPQLKGWSFDPRIAEVLEDYYPEEDEPIDRILGKVNRMMIGSLFITPVPHALNVWGHWIVGRGWDWMPQNFARLMKTGVEAMGEVYSKGPKYRQMLREGSGLLYGDTQVRNFYQLMLQKAGYEIASDPETWAQFAKTFRLDDMGIHTVKDFFRLFYRTSNKMMWSINDVFMMQRVLELERKGKVVRAAIKDAERDIPNYRIPSRVFGSRGWAQIMKSRQYMLFGRYRYGQWNALAKMFEDMIKGGGPQNPAARTEAFGKFIVMGVMALGAFPAADMLLQKATGDKDARVRRPGPFAILDAIYQRATGEKDIPTAVSSLVSPAPLPDTVVHVLNNRNFFGQKIIDEDSTLLGWAVQAGEFASAPLYPLALAEESVKPGGAAQAAGRMFGLDIPPAGTRARRKAYQAKDRAAALRREAHDPFEQAVRKAIGKATQPQGPPDEANRPHVPWPLSQ